MSDHRDDPIGVILAGGQGRRIGGSKAVVQLLGRPLISYPLAALRAVLAEVVVVAKADTELPEPSDAEVWIEPDQPRHPLLGIRYALERARGRAVFICGADMPLVTPVVVERIATARADDAPAVVASSEGDLQPLLALYLPEARELLAGDAVVPLREAVAAIGPRLIEIPERDAFFNVNTSEDLARAASRM